MIKIEYVKDIWAYHTVEQREDGMWLVLLGDGELSSEHINKQDADAEVMKWNRIGELDELVSNILISKIEDALCDISGSVSQYLYEQFEEWSKDGGKWTVG